MPVIHVITGRYRGFLHMWLLIFNIAICWQLKQLSSKMAHYLFSGHCVDYTARRQTHLGSREQLVRVVTWPHPAISKTCKIWFICPLHCISTRSPIAVICHIGLKYGETLWLSFLPSGPTRGERGGSVPGARVSGSPRQRCQLMWAPFMLAAPKLDTSDHTWLETINAKRT